jgi:hypothetical protein
MVCHCNVQSVCPQSDTTVLHSARSPHPAKAMTLLEQRQLALKRLAGTETVSRLDAETWGVRLLELQDQGFRPEATVADAPAGA